MTSIEGLSQWSWDWAGGGVDFVVGRWLPYVGKEGEVGGRPLQPARTSKMFYKVDLIWSYPRRGEPEIPEPGITI
eukprot:766602-Hanusia_phi.AAC.3